jgi:hypothetical protein
MVLGYWDMAASMVTTGAIDGDAFRAAHSEIVGAFAKIYPFLAELRKVSGVPTLCSHMEAVVLGAPDGQAALERMVEAVRTMARNRRSAAQTVSSSEPGG